MAEPGRLMDAMTNPLWGARDAVMQDIMNPGSVPPAELEAAIARALAASRRPMLEQLEESGAGIDYGERRLTTSGRQTPEQERAEATWGPVRDVGRGMVGALTGYDMAAGAGRNLAAAVEEGNLGRGVAAVGQGALAALPVTRLFRAMTSTVPRMAGTGALYGGVPSIAEEGLITEAQAQPPPRGAPPPAGAAEEDGLTAAQRARLRTLTQKQDQATRRNRESPESEQTELINLNGLLTDFQKERNRLRLEGVGAAEREAREAGERTRRQNTPIREAIPGGHWVLPALAGAVGGGVLGRAIARNTTSAFNTAISELSTRWQAAVARAQRARPTSNAHRLAVEEAQGIARQFQELTATGPGGHPIAAGIGAGELSMNMPAIVDYTTGGEDLRKRTLEELISPTGAGRVLLGAVAAGVPAKATSALEYSRRVSPPNYQAATDPLVAALRRRNKKPRP